MAEWKTAGKVRMTPKGVYDSTAAYDILDCVSNEDKTIYYVSKKAVPAGTGLSSTEYWDRIVDIDSLVSSLSAEIERLENIAALGYPQKSVTGTAVNVEGSLDAKLAGLTLYGKVVQDDTPTPTNPVAIDTPGVGGTLGVVSAGKNLIDLSYGRIPTAGSTYTSSGITFTNNGDGSISMSGTATANSIGGLTFTASYSAQPFKAFTGLSMKISLGAAGGFTSSDVRLYINYFKADGSFSSQVSVGAGESPRSFILNEDCVALRVFLSVASGITVDATVYPMLQLADITDTTFEAPDIVKTSVPVPSTGLPGIKVSSGGNYTDTSSQQWICDTIDMAAGTYTKRVGVVVLDGSQTPTISNGGTSNWFYNFASVFSDAPAANNPNDKSSHYPRVAISSSNTVQGFTASGAWLRIRYGTQDTVENYKAWLAQNPVTVVYALATPVTMAYKDMAIKTVSDSVVNVDDAAANNAEKVVVNIEPSQAGSGDPSPDNVREITGWTGANVMRAGKNLCPVMQTKTVAGVTYTVRANGSVKISGTPTSDDTSPEYVDISLPAGQYKLSGGISNTYRIRVGKGANGTTLIGQDSGSGLTFTLSEPDTIRVAIRISGMNGTPVSAEMYPMLQLASIADTSFETPDIDTFSFTFPSEAGTVYGGTLDVTSGVLTVDRAMADLGALNWSKTSAASASVIRYFTNSLRGVVKYPSSNSAVANAICSKYQTATANDGFNGRVVDCATVDISGSISVYPVATYADAAAFKTAMSGVQLVYELATSVTYQLTPQEVTLLRGLNNVYADCGSMTLRYRQDTDVEIKSHDGSTTLYTEVGNDLTAKIYISINQYIDEKLAASAS